MAKTKKNKQVKTNSKANPSKTSKNGTSEKGNSTTPTNNSGGNSEFSLVPNSPLLTEKSTGWETKAVTNYLEPVPVVEQTSEQKAAAEQELKDNIYYQKYLQDNNLPEYIVNPDDKASIIDKMKEQEKTENAFKVNNEAFQAEAVDVTNGNIIYGENSEEGKEFRNLTTLDADEINLNNLHHAKASGYTQPFDRRLSGLVYSDQKAMFIGSHMPKVAGNVGVSSLMNPYALIRFAHVANYDMAKYTILNADNSKFKGPEEHIVSLTIEDIEELSQKTDQHNADTTSGGMKKVSATRKSITRNGQQYVQIDNLRSVLGNEAYNNYDAYLKANYKQGLDNGYGQGAKLFQDSSGQIFFQAIDSNNQIWRAQNPDAATKTNGDGAAADITLPVDTLIPPTSIEYWLLQKGLVTIDTGNAKFKDNKNIKLAADANSIKSDITCANGNVVYTTELVKERLMSDTALETEEVTQTRNDIIAFQEFAKNQVAADWKVAGFAEQMILLPKLTGKGDAIYSKSNNVKPTVENLCDDNNWIYDPQFRYEWTDFLYCSEYPYIPNNKLITLRRFPVPVYDHGQVADQTNSNRFMYPIAKAVTWLGSCGANKIEDILKLKWGLKWKELTSKVEEVNGNEQGLESSGMSGMKFGGMDIGGALMKMSMVSTILGFAGVGGNHGASWGQHSGKDAANASFDPYKQGPYQNLPYGPVNCIDSTLIRDRGLTFENSISLKFAYSLKTIGGINSKAALLDIIANFLSLTSNNAAFWGGAVRYFPNKSDQYPYPCGKKGVDAWYNGDFLGFMGAIGDTFIGLMSSIGTMLKDAFTGGGGGIINTAKKLVSGYGKYEMGKAQRGHRPKALGVRALLTGEPVGEWHLMVGNPFNPIAMIGNLVVSDCEMTFSPELGPDDFPESVYFTVTLKHGKPRDKGDIESILNRGQGRLYYPPYGERDVLNEDSATKASTQTQAAVDPKSQTKMSKGLTTNYTNQQAKTYSRAVKSKQRADSNNYKTIRATMVSKRAYVGLAADTSLVGIGPRVLRKGGLVNGTIYSQPGSNSSKVGFSDQGEHLITNSPSEALKQQEKDRQEAGGR